MTVKASRKRFREAASAVAIRTFANAEQTPTTLRPLNVCLLQMVRLEGIKCNGQVRLP